MVELKTEESINAMRAPGRVVAHALAAAREAAAVGASLLDLDRAARAVLAE
ncbi:type I methionyl aminopeptidase, partial [Streptomyces sp. SID13726]|nr:type I methionyl aminopeptidase [Streptomyces sp. SID13726]